MRSNLNQFRSSSEEHKVHGGYGCNYVDYNVSVSTCTYYDLIIVGGCIGDIVFVEINMNITKNMIMNVVGVKCWKT